MVTLVWNWDWNSVGMILRNKQGFINIHSNEGAKVNLSTACSFLYPFVTVNGLEWLP